MKVKVQVVNAFSVDGTGGNPAGVVFDADRFSNQQKQMIAAQAGFPETAFVSQSEIADLKLDFFTPVKQIPHCGHATIATFSYLRQQGKIPSNQSSKETIDGTRSILFQGDLAFMEQRAPVFEVPYQDLVTIFQSLDIEAADLIDGLQPTIVNTGNSFMIIPLRNEALLSGIEYNRELVTRLSAQYGLIGYYLFSYTSTGGYDVTTRMFAPYYGIDEEAATGMAAGPMAAYLYQQAGIHKLQFKVEQGRYMQPASPSRILVNLQLEGSSIARLFAGGHAYVSGEKEVEIVEDLAIS